MLHLLPTVDLIAPRITILSPSILADSLLLSKRRSEVPARSTVHKQMKEYQRKQLLERIDREGATVGTQIPDTILVQDEEIDLQEFVFEITRRDTYPPGERERVENAKRNLRRERLQRRQRIENNEVDFEDGEKIAESIIGISRALEALQELEPDDIEGEAKRQEAADRKRWMSFLKQAMGREDGSSSRGRL